jgi:hypothetical protein
MDFTFADPQPKELSEKLLQRPKAELMRNVLVHRPTHKAMKMLSDPVIVTGHESMRTLATTIYGCAALDDPSFRTARSNHQVENPLCSDLYALGLFDIGHRC